MQAVLRINGKRNRSSEWKVFARCVVPRRRLIGARERREDARLGNSRLLGRYFCHYAEQTSSGGGKLSCDHSEQQNITEAAFSLSLV